MGYVGLPLAVAFAEKYEVAGFDIKESRISELKQGNDSTLEVDSDILQKTSRLSFTTFASDIKDCNVYIITVPTPIDKYNRPNLAPLLSASETVGKVLKKGDIVIYESTVYPGCTEEDCVPVLENHSGLVYNRDFFCGYSPERINPGDKEHTVTKIRKVVSGSTPEVCDTIDRLYSGIITAGTFKAASIKVAEAAKVIENSQRDINIAFVNELALIFHRMGIDTLQVLEAAATKWNFLPFKPGLVGGHCIGVDPFYLTFKAESLGYHPQVILAGRRINDTMGIFVANEIIKLMIKNGHNIEKSNVLVLGITFKENCPDIRNSKVIDIIRELSDFGCGIDVHDPWASPDEVKQEYSISLLKNISKKYEAIIFAVAHDQYRQLSFNNFIFGNSIIYDIKGMLPLEKVTGRL
ncbi:MAG: nucleotide sugar dehydrogenase [Spirochaetales bacterium]|nr:nucleotide sugar dehydrogenase [Spirochaetales bacterium]